MKSILIVLIVFLVHVSANAQDLNARVTILSPKVQNTNKRPLEVLEIAIRDFLNNRKWTVNQLKPNERIDCSFVLNLSEWDGSSSYKAEAQIISSRPVFGTSYNSTILSVSDKNFDFNYTEGQPLEFSDQNFDNNLSSILAFYAYIIIGLDNDTFSKMAGSGYYTKAQAVLNYSQNAPFTGWKAFENLRNRYWLIENLTNKSFNPLREILYTYHRDGLDQMNENINKARKTIANSLPDLMDLDKQKQGSPLNQVFYTAKSDEIINIFSKSDPQEKMKIYNLMVSVDPANQAKYETLKTAR